MLTVFVLLAVAACIVTIVHAVGRCPLWPAVLLLSISALRRALPLGR
jgi:hypothetical protein